MDADIDSPVSSTKSDSDANTNVSRTSSTHCQKKDIPSQGLSNRRKSDMEISQASNSGEDSPLEGSSVVHTKLPPGKVILIFMLLNEHIYISRTLFVSNWLICQIKSTNLIILIWRLQVVRRRKPSTSTGRPTSSQHRASFPMVRPQVSESKAAARLEQSMQPNIPYENGDNSSSERIDGK